MRTIAALVAGLLLSTVTFVAGLAIALTLLNIDEPDHQLDTSNTTALWSTEPQPVNTKSQHFERIAARQAVKPKTAEEKKVASLDTSAPATRSLSDQASKPDDEVRDQLVDPITTGAINPRNIDQQADIRKAQSAAHIEWCSRRYRSYNAETNSYRPYGGGSRDCQSPYSDFLDTLPAEAAEDRTDATVSAGDPMQSEQPAIKQASYDDGLLIYANNDHIQSCFDRYRSYRPEDNSYQPYDGGPRRQCR